MPQIATFTIFKFESNKSWAFAQMGLAPREFSKVPGLSFYKLMGCGQGLAFSIKPDFSRYSFFAVWDNLESANRFFSTNSKLLEFKKKADLKTYFLKHLQSKGTWDGHTIFDPLLQKQNTENSGPIAVLTRATVRLAALLDFWRHAPSSTKELHLATGLLYSIGVGELPFIRQATFSVWENELAMMDYAYGKDAHKKVIKLRKDNKWYSEELFARFELLENS